jgi:hypothetical protein
MKIHTYFENLYDYSYPVLCKFKASWESKGYEVVVHTFHQALINPLLKEYLASIERFPNTNSFVYSLCSFRRWLAYDYSIKGEDSIFICDYDVLNLSLTSLPQYNKPIAYYGNVVIHLDPITIKRFIHSVISIPDWSIDPKHNSDMTLWSHYFKIPRAEEKLVGEWPDTSKPLIHFVGNSTKRKLICFKSPL